MALSRFSPITLSAKHTVNQKLISQTIAYPRELCSQRVLGIVCLVLNKSQVVITVELFEIFLLFDATK